MSKISLNFYTLITNIRKPPYIQSKQTQFLYKSHHI